MKLYSDPYAPNPRRVRIFLAEKTADISITVEKVEIAKKSHQAEEFLAKNPLAKLPVLELDDGEILCESMAICRYFEELYPEPPLLGATPLERARVEQWNRHMEFELLLPITEVFRNTHEFWVGRIKQAPEFGVLMRELVLERFAWLDGELASRQFIAGDAFTVADITGLCAIDFGRPSKLRIPRELSHLSRWYAEISARDSAKA